MTTKEVIDTLGYEDLEAVLKAALQQAAVGKGKERHANDRPFREQPMQVICELLGSHDGMLYQAIKKVQESKRMPTDRAIHELLGAIVYTAGAIVYLQREKKHE